MYNLVMAKYMEEKLIQLRELTTRMAGQRLPSERDLAESLQVSRPTIRAWLAILEQEGMVQRRRGSGTYAVDVHTDLHAIRSVSLLIDASLKLGDDPFFSLLVDQLLASMESEHMQCTIERIGSNDQFPLRLRDGAITVGQAGQAVIKQIRTQDPPLVSVLLASETKPNARISILQTADSEAGAEAVRHLLRAGCQELLFVGKQEIIASYERWQGAEQCAREAGIGITFHSNSLNYNTGLQVGKVLASTNTTNKQGIIATNDWLALGIRTGLLSSGIPIEQLPIVSFDGLAATADPDLGIDSLAIPITTIADDAVKELQRLSQLMIPAGRTVRYPLYWRTA
jgi:DNA-binding LacI/PurR family transcriptional regulator